MREHYRAESANDGVVYTPTDGLWMLPAGGSTLRRVRPFLATKVRAGSFDEYFRGDQGFLAIRGDRVLFQAYPYDIHFDGLSWRMLNRLPAAGGQTTGWALQGPYVGDAAAAGTGLQAGVYGIARCVLSIISLTTWHAFECSQISLPGSDRPTTTTDEQALLWAPSSPALVDAAAPIAAFADRSWDGDRVLLSFDPGRQGFWRGTDLEARFHPVVDGQMLQPTIDLDLSGLGFGMTRENSYLWSLYYHPQRGRLFGSLSRKPYTSPSRENVLFSLDPETGAADDLGSLFDDDIFGAFTFASFGDQPQSQEQIIPIIADAPGKRGTAWRTDLWLYNPSNTTTTVRLTRLRRPDVTEDVTLAAHASRHIPDILVELGGGAGGDGDAHDALLVSSAYRWAEQVVAFARIWTRDPATGGTFGHAVPAVPAPFGYSNHSVSDPSDLPPTELRFNYGANSLASHIDLDLRQPGRYRHNLGVVNPTDDEVTIQLAWTFREYLTNFEFAGPDIEGFRRASIVVPPHDLKIVGIEDLFPEEVVEGWVPRLGVFGAEPAIIWYSMVDNLTGDATFVPFTSFTATAGVQISEDLPETLIEYRLAIPAVAHGPGVGTSVWQTDLYGYFDEYRNRPAPFAAYHPSRLTDCPVDPERGEISHFVEGELGMPIDRWLETLLYPPEIGMQYVEPLHTIFPDIVHRFWECGLATSTRGGLEILAGDWFSGFSRTFTTRADGGTYGGMLPLYPPGGWPVQHFAGLQVREGGRINIGLFNGDHRHTITNRVTLYDGNGRSVAERSVDLESLASLQREITHFFGLASLPSGAYGLTVLPLDNPDSGIQGHSWAYVSVIDNLTNDPVNLW
jgi:hypothetical protein